MKDDIDAEADEWVGDAWVDGWPLNRVRQHSCVVTIDPGKTIEQMVEDGHYDNFHTFYHTSDIFEAHRVVKGTTPAKAKVVAFRIGHESTTDQAKRIRDRLHFGAIGIDHELAFLPSHADRGLDFFDPAEKRQLRLLWRVVNIDSEVVINGYMQVSCFHAFSTDNPLLFKIWYGYDWDFNPNHLGLCGAESTWDKTTWFLGIMSGMSK